MRELNMIEVESVSGGGNFVDVVSGTMGGILNGMTKGAAIGASGISGGLLGFGLIGTAVGTLVGGWLGAQEGFYYGLVSPEGEATDAFIQAGSQWLSPSAPFPQVGSSLAVSSAAA